MKLPRAENLVIEREKIVSYLLNTDHPYGSSKATFFGLHGFHLENWSNSRIHFVGMDSRTT
jgi:hypothetical protein